MLGFLIIAPAQQPALGQTEPGLQNLVDEYSESPRLNYFVGRFYRIHDRSEKSFTYFTKAVQLSPHLEEGHLALAEYHLMYGDPQMALALTAKRSPATRKAR